MKLKLAILSAFVVSATAAPKISLRIGGGYTMAELGLKTSYNKKEKEADAKSAASSTVTASPSTTPAASTDTKTSDDKAKLEYKRGHGGFGQLSADFGWEVSGVEFGLTGGASMIFARPTHEFDIEGKSKVELAKEYLESEKVKSVIEAALKQDADQAEFVKLQATQEYKDYDAISKNKTDSKNTEPQTKSVEISREMSFMYNVGIYGGGYVMDKLSVKAGGLVTFTKGDLEVKIGKGKDDKGTTEKVDVRIGLMPFATLTYDFTSKIGAFVSVGYDIGISDDYEPGKAKTDKKDEKKDEKTASTHKEITNINYRNTLLVSGGVSVKLM